MLIPTGETIRCTARGSTLKSVRCEECQQNYHYAVSCSATGQGNNFLFLNSDGAEAKARQEAQAELEQELATAILPVPCPHCGRYQLHMIHPARVRYAHWMRLAGWCLIVGSLILAFPFFAYHSADPNSITAARGVGVLKMTFGLGVAAFLVRWLLSSRYDPNRLPRSRRLEQAKAWAFTDEELLRLQAESAGQD